MSTNEVNPNIPPISTGVKVATGLSGTALAVSTIGVFILLVLYPQMGTLPFSGLMTAEGLTFILFMVSLGVLGKRQDERLARMREQALENNSRPPPRSNPPIPPQLPPQIVQHNAEPNDVAGENANPPIPPQLPPQIGQHNAEPNDVAGENANPPIPPQLPPQNEHDMDNSQEFLEENDKNYLDNIEFEIGEEEESYADMPELIDVPNDVQNSWNVDINVENYDFFVINDSNLQNVTIVETERTVIEDEFNLTEQHKTVIVEEEDEEEFFENLEEHEITTTDAVEEKILENVKGKISEKDSNGKDEKKSSDFSEEKVKEVNSEEEDFTVIAGKLEDEIRIENETEVEPNPVVAQLKQELAKADPILTSFLKLFPIGMLTTFVCKDGEFTLTFSEAPRGKGLLKTQSEDQKFEFNYPATVKGKIIPATENSRGKLEITYDYNFMGGIKGESVNCLVMGVSINLISVQVVDQKHVMMTVSKVGKKMEPTIPLYMMDQISLTWNV